MNVDPYKITNKVNGTVYIGQARCCESRWRSHCSSKKKASAISCAIKKYGQHQFTFEKLGSCLSQKAGDIAEIALIAYWKSKGKIYNRSDGGNGCRRRGGYTLSTIAKINIGKGSKEVWARLGHKVKRGKLISRATIGKKKSKVQCLAIKKGLTGRHLSILHKMAISRGVADGWKNPIIRKRRCDGLSKALKGNVNLINGIIRGWKKRRKHA